nr:replication factor C subunit 2 [Tanacetum cinerariifolium]
MFGHDLHRLCVQATTPSSLVTAMLVTVDTFLFSGNTSAKIIEPVQSRCALVRFSRLSYQEILGRLMIVVDAEKVDHFTTDGNNLEGDL